MSIDKVLTPEEYEIDEGILENLRLGYFEEVGLGDDGEMRYRLTEKGKRYVENMGKKDPPRAMAEPARRVVIRKGVQEGLPCLEGTRLTTRTLRALFLRGISVGEIAHLYEHLNVDAEAVEVALRYEMRRRRK